MTDGAAQHTRASDSEAVTQLILRERQTRDRGWYDEIADCFTPDELITMSWFTGPASDFIVRTRARTTGRVWGRHRLSPPAVRISGDRAWGELPLAIEFQIDVGGTPADLISYCRSQYLAERTDLGWKIASITSIYERDTLTRAVPGHHLTINPTELTGRRDSYRYLAWYFAQQGTPLPGDLFGDDQPDAVGDLYQSVRRWLDAEI